MYESFFNLAAKPFDLLPNPDFLFLSKSHKRALSYLDYGIRERAGFILLTGEVGSGKTTIIRNLIRKHLDNVILSKVFNTKVDSEQLISMINDDFGLATQSRSKTVLLRDLNDFLIEQFVKGNRPVLIIDEAQNLAPELLEEVRMLSNLETDSAKLLQIILVGQPELRMTLASPEMVQLRQRISINCHLQPLTRVEMEQYILHRLETAGDRNAVEFTTESFDNIFAYSRGIPRLINIICDFLLLSAFAEGTAKIDGDMVLDIVRDLDFENHFWNPASSLPAPLSAAGLPSPDLASVVREMNGRVDALGKETESANQKIFQDLVSKLEGLEQNLKKHQESTGTLIQEIRADISTPGTRDKSEDVVDVENKKRKTGFIRRMFGDLS